MSPRNTDDSDDLSWLLYPIDGTLYPAYDGTIDPKDLTLAHSPEITVTEEQYNLLMSLGTPQTNEHFHELSRLIHDEFPEMFKPDIFAPPALEATEYEEVQEEDTGNQGSGNDNEESVEDTDNQEIEDNHEESEEDTSNQEIEDDNGESEDDNDEIEDENEGIEVDKKKLDDIEKVLEDLYEIVAIFENDRSERQTVAHIRARIAGLKKTQKEIEAKQSVPQNEEGVDDEEEIEDLYNATPEPPNNRKRRADSAGFTPPSSNQHPRKRPATEDSQAELYRDVHTPPVEEDDEDDEDEEPRPSTRRRARSSGVPVAAPASASDPAAVPLTVTATTRSPGGGFSHAEFMAITNIIRELRTNEQASGIPPSRQKKDVTLFEYVSRKMGRMGFDKNAGSCKNFWNRYGRVASGYDERVGKKKNPSLVTSSQARKK